MKLKIYLLLIASLLLQLGYGQAPNWEVQSGNYRYSTSLICTAFDECVETANANDIIGVFDKNDICRGKANFLSFAAGYRAFVTIYSNTTSEDLYFRIYKADQNMVFYAYINKVEFLAEAIQGTISAPIEVLYDSSIEVDAGEDRIIYNKTTTTLAATGDKQGNSSWFILYGGGGSFGDASSATSTFSGQYDSTYFLVWAVADQDCINEMDHLLVTFKEYSGIIDDCTLPPPAQGIISSGTYHVSNTITTAGKVLPSSEVTIKAGISITLTTGFQAQAGSTFTASIIPCSSSDVEMVETRTTNSGFEYSDIIVINEELRMKNEALMVFPNPVQERLTIVNGQGAATLYNALGQVVSQFQITSAQFQMEVSGLPEGIYTLQVRSADGTVLVQQVVK